MHNNDRIAAFCSRMDAYLDEYCRIFTFSGFLRITLKDEIIYERPMGFADVEHGVPITADSRFTFYSISKQFCAIGFLLLCDRGLASLSDHPKRYVPEAEGFDERVTFAHMLVHTSGMADFGELSRLKNAKSFDTREAIAELSTLPSHFAPGTSAHYANINFALTALAIESITGMRYADYMAKEVFSPLGMSDTCIDRNGLLISNRVRGYNFDGIGFCSDTPDLSEMLGAGDVNGSANDLYKLNLAIKNKLLLRPETWDAVTSSDPVSSYGLGCGVFDWHGKKRVNQSGGHLGFRTLHFQLPEDDFDFILLSNCGYGNSRNAIAEAAHTAFYGDDGGEKCDFKMDKGYIPDIVNLLPEGFLPKLPDRYQMPEETLEGLLGRYRGMTFYRQGEDFVMELDSGRRIVCYPAGENLLAAKHADEMYGIAYDENKTPIIHLWKKL